MRLEALMLALAIGAAGPIACAHAGAPAATAAATPARQAPDRAASAQPASHAAPWDAAYTSPVLITTGRTMTGTLFLRATPGASQGPVLHLTIAHGGYWAIFNHAVDREGHRYSIVPTREHVSCGTHGCTYYENVDVSIPEAEIARAVKSGLVLRITGAQVTYLAELPADYVASFVHGMAQEEARRAAETVPVPAAPAPKAP